MAEIAEKVGFDDPSYFSKVFRRVTGLSPGKFRETGGRALLHDEAKTARKKGSVSR